MNEDPMFDPKRTASILRAYFMQQLHDLQKRILIIERFGPDAVPWPKIQSRLGSIHTLQQDLDEHTALVAKIRALTFALERADEMDMKAFAEHLMRTRGL